MKLNKIIVAQMSIRYMLWLMFIGTGFAICFNYYSLLHSKKILLMHNSNYVALESKQKSELQPLISWWRAGIKNNNRDYVNLPGSSLLEESDILPPINAPSFCKYVARKYIISYSGLLEFINNMATLPNDLYIVSIVVSNDNNSLVLTLQVGLCDI